MEGRRCGAFAPPQGLKFQILIIAYFFFLSMSIGSSSSHTSFLMSQLFFSRLKSLHF